MTERLIRQEVLVAATEVAHEKGIDREKILHALEQAFEKVAHAKYGEDISIKAEVDRSTAEIKLFQQRTVVAKLEDPDKEITLSEAKKQDETLQEGDVFSELLPPANFERIATQTMRQVISTVISEAVRSKEYAEYKDRVGEVISGVVKLVDYGNVVLDLGHAEGLLKRDDLIPRERFQPGDRVRAYIRDVIEDPRGHQIFLSRTHPDFMKALFQQEVPEVYSGTIQIKSVARDPGSRAKIGVWSDDPSIDPVGSCVGVRGSRVQAVTQELAGERIDVIHWSEDLLTFLVNALTPAEIVKVVMGDDDRRVEVVVPDDQLSLAIGRRGQNVRLASQLVNIAIDIVTESDELKRRTELTEALTKMFMESLTIDDMVARLLISEGFESLEDITAVELHELSNLEGFTEELAQEIQGRAQHALSVQDTTHKAQFIENGGDKALAELSGLPAKLLAPLAENDIKTLPDFADLSSDELLDIAGKALDTERAESLIMHSRSLVNTTNPPQEG